MPPLGDRTRTGAVSGTAMPQPLEWAKYPLPAAPAATATPATGPSAGMSRDQVAQYVQNFYAQQGVTPNPTSVDYWTDKYFSPEFNGDINYWNQRLGQADEFTGVGQAPSGGRAAVGVPTGSGAPSGAVGSLGGLIGGGQNFTPEQIMQMDPGYGFRLGQGQQAIERGAAAHGTLLTGGTQKALQRYAQDYASGEFGNIFNRNLGLAQLGLGAASQEGAFGSAYANQVGQDLTANANAQGAGSIAQGNIWSGLPTQLAQLYNFYNSQNNQPSAVPDPYSNVPGSFGTIGTGF